GMRDFRMMTPSGRRSTAMSRASHSILRKAGLVNTAAALPLILRLPEFSPLRILSSSPDIDRLSLFEKARPVECAPIDAIMMFDQQRLSHADLPASASCGAHCCALSPCGSRDERSSLLGLHRH